jgi:hypothetical protein
MALTQITPLWTFLLKIAHQNLLRTTNSEQSIFRGPFEKFVDSSYYSESEFCGGAVTVSFSKYLPWQAVHFVQRSTHSSKTCCRLFITSKFLASELPFHGWGCGLYGGYSNGILPIHSFQAEHKIKFRSHPIRFLEVPCLDYHKYLGDDPKVL